MFIGEYFHNLDTKGRIIIPSKFRDELHSSFILTRGLDGCLTIYSLEQWEKIFVEINKLPTTKKAARQYIRVLTSNACECVLVDEKIKDEFLPLLAETLNKFNVVLKGDKEVNKIMDCELINDEDYKLEYNDLILNIKIAKDYQDAINHINNYSTHHSDCIVTNDKNVASIFLKNVDSGCVYHNASTRFSDGGCFGFGAEVGISTQKLHARGPMGLAELTSYKYVIEGNGEVRK